jgi:hypothetical protein
VGGYHDAASLLRSIGSTMASHKATLLAMHVQRDVEIGPDIEAIVLISSFLTQLPTILLGGSTNFEIVDKDVSLEYIFEDLRAARYPIQDTSENDPSVLLWGIIKSHKIMEECIRHEVKRHPPLNGILVQKLLESSPTSGLHAKIQAVENTASSLNGAISGIKPWLTAVEGKVWQVNNS